MSVLGTSYYSRMHGGGGDVLDRMVEEEDAVVMGEKDLWLAGNDDASCVFYNDTFPSLPDFPCMSSSSSSSPTAASKAANSSCSAASSSPAASWAVMKSDAEEEMNPNQYQNLNTCPPPPPPSDLDCLDAMGDFGYTDLIDSNELWDPSTVFQTENSNDFMDEETTPLQCSETDTTDGFSFLNEDSELAVIFLDWLKQNKDYISADDMRSIKLKRSTIESASKRLGCDKEGKKQLLRLILEWVEQCQIHKKRQVSQAQFDNPSFAFGNHIAADQNNTCFAPQTWIQPPPPPPPPQPQTYPYGGDAYMNHPYQMPFEYPVMEHAQSWAGMVAPPPYGAAQPQFSTYPENCGGLLSHQPGLYGNPYQVFDPSCDRLMRLGSSATKEARKKRMARQRRLYSHHQHQHHNQRHNGSSNQQQSQLGDAALVVAGGDGGGEEGNHGETSGNNWMYWPSGCNASNPATCNAADVLVEAPPESNNSEDQPQSQQPTSSTSERKQQQQGWKTEKNLKFLLQKVLKQSDVGNLGRIVLPKKEAESHLPELESRDGISIAMEDIGTSRVWNMRYRFWPNNKSRMYLLENTGDFVRVNGLQEGDFIVIYSDTKCGKYMIRGVKVRQPGSKPEIKKPARRNSRSNITAGNGSSLAPIRQAVR